MRADNERSDMNRRNKINAITERLDAARLHLPGAGAGD